MPQENPVQPGQLTSIPENNYVPGSEGGHVTSNLPYVAPPTAPNLLFDNTAPTTTTGISKVNPAYALYINTLKNNNAKQAFLSTPYYTNAKAAERYSDNSAGGYHPYDMNLENWYGDKQGWLTQWGNRLGKMGTKALGSFANSIMDIPNIIDTVAKGESLDKMWDNNTNNWANNLMDWGEKNLPNYETNWEREHPFKNLIPIYGNSGNGWGKVVENLGFTIGAVGGAVAEDFLVGLATGGAGEVPLAAMQINKAVYKLGKLINAGEDTLGALKTSIKSADDIVKGLKGIDRLNYIYRKGLWGANMITSGVGEAAFEGLDSYNNLTKDLQQQFLEENGRMPTHQDSQTIDRYARQAGNTRFLLNTGLLAITNSIQWGSILRPLNATKDLIEAEAKQGVRVALQEGSRDVFEAVEHGSKLLKWGKKAAANPVLDAIIGSGSEGFEEGAQYAIETGVNDFYKKKYDARNIQNTNSFLASFGKGMSSALGTQQGWENIVGGLLGGALYKGGEHIYYHLKGIDINPDYKKQIESVLHGLNTNTLSGIFENKYAEATNAIAIQKDLQDAAATGNAFKFQNYKHDQFVDFILSGLQQNKYDTRIEQLQELKKLDKDEFEKTFGIPQSDDNKKTVNDYVNALAKNAEYIKDIHKRVSRTFINPFVYKGTGSYTNAEAKKKQDEINEKSIIYESTKNDLVRYMSIAKNSADRISAINSQISGLQSVVEPSTVLKLSSLDGLKELKKEYKEKKDLADESLKLNPKDAKNKKDSSWYGSKIDEISSLLDEKDNSEADKKYNKLLNDVFDHTQIENNTYYALYGTPQQATNVFTPFPRDVQREVISLGQDSYLLNKRSEIAIDRYSTLTTKGGFKKRFEEEMELRKKVAELQVTPEQPALEGQAAQQQAAFNVAQAQQGQPITSQPQQQNSAQTQQETAPQGQQGYIAEEVRPIPEDQRVRLNRILTDAVDGNIHLSEAELGYLGFKSIDDVKFEDPKANIADYKMAKASDSKRNFYIHKDAVEAARKVVAGNQTQSPVENNPVSPPDDNAGGPPIIPSTPPPTTEQGGLRTGDFMGKIFVPGDLKQPFNNAIFSGTKDQVKQNVSIVVRPLSPQYQAEYEEQQRTRNYTEVRGFPGVYSAKAPIDLSVFHNGIEIGKVAYPKRLLFKVGNDFVNIDRLTPEQYQQFTGKPAAQHAADVDEFNKQVALTNLLALRFRNNGLNQVELNSKEFNDMVDIALTYGELDLVSNESDRPLFSELKHNTIPISTPIGNINSMVVFSVPKRFIGDTMTYGRTDFITPIFGQNFYDTPGASDQVVMDYKNSNVQSITNVGSRYVGLIAKPDSTFALVALRPAEMTQVSKDQLFATLKSRSQESANANFVEGTADNKDGVLLVGEKEIYYKLPSDAAKAYNDQFNTEINNNLYITDDKGVNKITLSVSPIGAVRLEVYAPDISVNDPESGKQKAGYRTTIYIAPQVMASINSFDEMLDFLVKEIAKRKTKDAELMQTRLTLRSSNFRQNIANDDKVKNAEEIAGATTAATSREVFRNGTMRILPKTNEVQTAYNSISRVANQQATTEQTVQGEQPIIQQAVETPSTTPASVSPEVRNIINNIHPSLTFFKRTGTRGSVISPLTNDEWNILEAQIKGATTLNDVTRLLSINGGGPYNIGIEETEQNPEWTNKLANTLFEYVQGNYNISLREYLRDTNKAVQDRLGAASQTSILGTLLSGLAQTDENFSNLGNLLGEPSIESLQQETPQGEISPSTPQNQEDMTEVVFDNVRDALASMDIGYRSTATGTEFYTISTGEIIDISGVAPKDLAAEMGLTIREQGKPDTGGFDFMRSNKDLVTLNKLVNFEKARAYITSILPSFIKVEDLNTVLDQIREQGLENPEMDVWGAFKNGVIYLNKQSPSVGQEYHEAFHAVFSMFLSKAQQEPLLNHAKNELYKDLKAKGKSIRDYIAEQRNNGSWTNISESEAIDRAAEEWMAEAFRKWNVKKNNAGIFEKIFDAIARFFKWLTRSGSELDAVFNKINAGGYKYSNITSNSFTQETTEENTTPEFKFMLIPTRPKTIAIGRGTRSIKQNLDPKTSKQVVQNVAAYFEMYKKTNDQHLSDDKLLDKILDDLRLTYDPRNARYAGATQEQLNAIANSDENFIYSDENSRGVIKDAAKKYINSMNYFEQFNEDELETEEQDTGSPSTGYDNRSENVGGFSSIPGMLRHYIGFTSYEITDKFGNKTIEGGKPVVATVDAISVYYGLLRATANIPDPVRFFQRMIRFADNNEQSRYFVKKFIKDTGLNEDALAEGRIEATDNKALVEIVRKGFNKYRIDYTFTQYDMSKSKYESYAANRRNVENVQFDSWSNRFISGYSEMSDAAKRDVRTLLDNVRNRYFDERRTTIHSAEEQRAIVNEVRAALLGAGIQVSYDYIRYSLLNIAAKKYDALAKEVGAEMTLEDPRNAFISKADYNYVQIMKVADEISLTREFMDELSKTLAANANPYFREVKTRTIEDPENSGQTIEVEEQLDTAMITRLQNVGKGNAFFDETVGESSFTTADNKVVFAHQDGTFNVKASYELRDADYRKQLRETGIREEATAYMDANDTEWLTDNHLLKSDDFEAIADNLIYQNVDGMRVVETNKAGKVITQEFRDQKDGVTYGSYSPREFLLNNLNFYVSGHKIQKTSKGDITTTPHLIRVLEASKTGAVVNLPVNLDVYRDGSVTEKTIDILTNEVNKEYKRIQRVQSEIGTRTDNIVENYHTGSFKVDADGNTTDEIDKGYRGLKFTDNMTSLLSKTTAERLERKARSNEALSEEDINTIKQEVKDSLNKMVDDTINLMNSEGIIKIGEKGSYQNVLLDLNFFLGNTALNLRPVSKDVHFKTNIGHVLINDYINTLAYNQILHGDSALSLKNDGGIEAVKRAKGDNAAIVSIRTDLLAPELGITKPFTHSSVAIFKEPVAADRTKVADAQMYTTTEGLRYTLWGLGRLSPRVARLINALEAGEDIHALRVQTGVDEQGNPTYSAPFDGVFDKDNGLLAWDEMTNSLKLVFKDGKTYFKMSVVVLQPNLTATKSTDGTWTTIPGWETLDALRRKMEKDGIHFAAPESASKMMTLDVSKAKDFSDLKGHLFDNQYFGLQTENPSNKLEITTPTQLLQLIDSEQDDAVEVNFAGQNTTVGVVKNAYQDAVSQKATNSYEVARNEIYNIEDFNQDVNKLVEEGKVTPQLNKFYQRALSTLEASGSDAQLLDFFSLDANGNVRFNANLSAIKSKSQQLYLAYFSKGVMSQRNPGYTVALFSGIDTKTMRRAVKVENGQVLEWEHIRKDQYLANHEGVKNQRILTKSQVTEAGQIFTDELQHMVPRYNKDGNILGYHSEMMLPAHFSELLGLRPGDEIPEAIAYMFGVRIPSQDKHSFISLKLIDFLPANLGSTGIFAKELIKLSGADFDIDKLFITRYDFYINKDKNGVAQFHKYGSATTDRGKWNEYKRWMLENNKSVKNTVRDILMSDSTYQELKDEQEVLRELQMEDVFDDAAKQLKKSLYDRAVAQAFSSLKLPSTIEQFVEVSKTRELNNGVLNNRILDSYIALQTNKGMHDIAATPATLTALENIQKNDDITIKMKDVNRNTITASVFEKKTNYPIDSPIGKYYGFKNNTTGKNNIGIDVNANLIYSVANKGGIKLENGENEGFVFDGRIFSSFAGDREYNLETGRFDGKRTNDILSTLITAATDEAKEQLNALYNLGVDALKVVNYLVGLKVPLKTAIYLVNQPSVRNYLNIKATRQNTIQTREEEELFKKGNVIFAEEAKSKTRKQIKDYKDLSEDQMFSLLESNGIIEVQC